MTSLDARDRRRLGMAMLAYGVLGTLLFAGLLVGLVAAGSVLSDAPDRAAAGIDRVVRVLDSTADTLASVELTLDNAGTTLTTTAQTIDGAASTLTGIGGNLDSIGTGLTAFSILGATPLATVGGSVSSLADQVSGIGGQIGGISSGLTTNATDTASVATEIAGLRSDLRELRDALVGLDLAAFGRTVSLVRYAMVAVVAWLAVGSIGLAWFGWRLRKPIVPANPESTAT
jgi:hypothetical protein